MQLRFPSYATAYLCLCAWAKADLIRRALRSQSNLMSEAIRVHLQQEPVASEPFVAVNAQLELGEARTVQDVSHCKDFDGPGRFCKIEYPEHALVRKHLPANATVMEFGARFGTTTCAIANKLSNSGRQVAIEPDWKVWDVLDGNLRRNNCGAQVLHGACSSSPIVLSRSSYAGRSSRANSTAAAEANGSVIIPTFSFDDIESRTGLRFDTLLIDCEGCAQDIVDEIEPKLAHQISLIIIEADMPAGAKSDCRSHCMHYPKFFALLEKYGFRQVEKINDCDREKTGTDSSDWCGPWIDHYVFRRHAGAI